MESETQRLARTRETVETDLRSQYAGMGAGMDRVQQDLRLLTGRVEQLEHKIQRSVAAERVDDDQRDQRRDASTTQVAGLERRLAAVEQYLGLQPPSVAAAATPGDAKQPARPFDAGLNETQLYEQAKQAFDNGQMETSREGFQQLLKRFPQSSLVNNAQFWIGETHYRERWYEKAILEYQTVIEKYPNGNKVPAAMLKQGMAFLQLGDEANARLVWKALEDRFPQSSEAKVAATRLKEL
ncbi:MAG: tol-pal system protein YbgF, partial [Desulfatitalea sp.]|nr:tol-pal system protein YbgF [Desulfatitalea sp.]